MAKIQYIRPSSIEFDSPSYSSAIPKAATHRTDPALKVLAGIGIGGIVVAIVALLFSIVAIQGKKHIDTILTEATVDRVSQVKVFLARSLEEDAIIKLNNGLQAVVALYKEGHIGKRKMQQFLSNIWIDLFEKSISRALIIGIFDKASGISDIESKELAKAIEYFQGVSDQDIMIGGSFTEETEDDLFPNLNTPSISAEEEYEEKEEDIPSFPIG